MLPGGPAAACPLIRPGDLVLQAEGQHVTGMPLDHVYHLLLGARGSPCVLLVGKHDGGREEVVQERKLLNQVQDTEQVVVLVLLSLLTNQ